MRLVLWGLLALFGVVGARLADLQTDPDLVFSEDEKTHVGSVVLQIPRGDILDREGRIVATDRRVSSLSANPAKVSDPKALAAELAKRLGLDESQIYSRLTRKNSRGKKMKFVWIDRRLSDERLQALGNLKELGGAALRLEYEPVRFYPENNLASHVLGFVNDERVGSAGIEMAYDAYLRATDGLHTARVDMKRQILPSRTLDYVPPTGGANVQLTIDRSIQHKLEQQLAKRMEECKAGRAAGIVMDPKTGAILALACLPSFDPNRFSEFGLEQMKNTAVVDVFEPGSAFKIVTASAALERGLVTPQTIIDCENGAFNPYGHRISDYHKLGVEPFSTCFAESSNIAIIKVAAMLGEEELENWIRRFGFGEKTSPDFGMAESRGLFSPRTQWSRLSMGSLPMGQEIAVTLPQLARAFSVVANGGYLVEPYLVERAVNPDGTIAYEHDPSKRVRVISQATSDTMKALCHEVVTHGTGTYANIEEYRVGGKTGTAQIAKKDGRGYEKGKYTTVFAGFAPVADPRMCAVIAVYEPDIKLHYGGYVCGPVFKEVVRDALIRMNCPEDPVGSEVPKAALDSGDADTVVARLELELIEPELEDILESLDGLELIGSQTDSVVEGPGLPDFRGMTKRQAKAMVASLGLHWDIKGSGWVAVQDPPVGTPLKEVELCRLIFSNRHIQKDDETERTPDSDTL